MSKGVTRSKCAELGRKACAHASSSPLKNLFANDDKYQVSPAGFAPIKSLLQDYPNDEIPLALGIAHHVDA
jgi:hypothetical protein